MFKLVTKTDQSLSPNQPEQLPPSFPFFKDSVGAVFTWSLVCTSGSSLAVGIIADKLPGCSGSVVSGVGHLCHRVVWLLHDVLCQPAVERRAGVDGPDHGDAGKSIWWQPKRR